MPGPVALLLLLLSIAVLTVCLDRVRWWLVWWRQRLHRRHQWQSQLERAEADLSAQLDEWDWQMAYGEPLLRAATLLAPLLGLVGTVFGLMQLLARLGPDLSLPADASLQGYGRVLLSTGLGLLIALLASSALELNRGLRHWQIRSLDRQLRRRRQGAA